MSSTPTIYKNMLAVALIGELNNVLDKIELYASGDRRSAFVEERLNLKRAREQLSKIINDLEPESGKLNGPIKPIKAVGT